MAKSAAAPYYHKKQLQTSLYGGKWIFYDLHSRIPGAYRGIYKAVMWITRKKPVSIGIIGGVDKPASIYLPGKIGRKKKRR